MTKKKVKKIGKKGSLGIVFSLSIIVIFFSLFLLQFYSKNEQTVIKVGNVNAAGPVVWQQFDGNANKTGSSIDPYINASTVTSLRKLWTAQVTADSSPVYLSGINTPQGTKNLIFVTTSAGGLDAFDEETGTLVWSVTTQGAAGPMNSSPAIDPSNQYVYGWGRDGKVHKYDVGTGTEETAGGWPLTVTLRPNIEKASAALSIGNGYLYAVTDGYPGDAGNYQGHIVAKNLTTGTVTVFNTLCANITTVIGDNQCASSQSGIWGRPGTVVDSNTGNIFIATGNGPYNVPDNLGDSIIELAPDLSKVIDTYTPTNFQDLDNEDEDLGSTAVAIIPSLDIGIQGGKDDKIRVVNLKNMSGKGAPYNVGGELQTIPVDCNILSYPISWNNGVNIMVFVTDMCGNLYAYKVVNNQLTQVYKNTNGGSSPLLVNNLLFIQSSGAIKALNPITGAVIWTGQVGSMHWESPAVVDGHVFVLSSGQLTAFGLSIEAPTPSISQGMYIPPTALPSPTPIKPTYYILQLGTHNQ